MGSASSSGIRRRALDGAVLVTLRGFVVRLIGLGTVVVTARFIAPDEFGIFALGNAMVVAGTLLSDAGMAASLVRGPSKPAAEDLRAVQAFGLLMGLGVVAIAFAIGLPFGRVGEVIAIMTISLPIIAARVPTLAMLERELEYRPVVVIEISETIAYSAFVVTALIAGAGVWGLAGAVVFRAAAGTFATSRVPGGLVMPVWNFARLRPILRFGLQYQGISVVRVVSEQVFNAGVALIAGLATLGIWGIAARIVQIPQTVFESLRRVTFPAMARLNEAGEDLRVTVEKSAAVSGIVAGVVLLPVVGMAPTFIPLVFGSEWRDAADALPGVCLALVIGSPVSIAVAGYLLAAGHAGIVLKATIARAVVALAVILPLIASIGVTAIGIGYLVGALVEAAMLGRATRRAVGARLARSILPSAAGGVVSIGIGYLIGWRDNAEWPLGLAAGAASLAVFLAWLRVWAPEDIRHVRSLLRAGLKSRRRGS